MAANVVEIFQLESYLTTFTVLATQDSLETIVILRLMNVKLLDARMDHVKTSLMHLGVLVIQGGLEFSVILISITVFWTLDLDHVTILELEPVLMATPRTHVSVWMAMLVMTAP